MLEDVAAVVDTDLESGATLLGDHLVEGSDLAGERESCALVASFRQIVAELRPRRALLVGPSAVELVGLLPAESSAHLLVRHVIDARAIAAVVTDRPDDRLYSGGFEFFHEKGPYDLIVILGGGPEVLSPIAEGITEKQILAKAKSLLATDGLLLYSAENALGIHDLLAAEADVPPGDDRLWYLGKSKLSQRPWLNNELTAALGDLEFNTIGCLLAYPSPNAPDVIVDADTTSDATRQRVRQELPRVFTDYFSDRTAIRNPGATADLVAQSGLDKQLAPAWFYLLSTGRPEVSLPELVIAEPDTAPAWSFVQRYDADGACTLTWGDGASTTQERSVLGVSRVLSVGAAPEGTNLELVLREACKGSDHGTLRRLMKQYRSWLESPAEDGALHPDQRWFATPNNVVITTDGELAIIDPSWSVTRADAESHAFVHGVRTFATRLLAAGVAHPWGLPITPDTVTRTLAAMAAVTVGPYDLESVADIEVDIAMAVGTEHGDRDDLLGRNLSRGSRENHLPEATAVGFRELLSQVRTLSQTVRAQNRQLAWLEGTMKLRDRRIAEYDRLMFKLEESLGYKVMRTLGAPKRVAVARAKERVDEAVPTDVRKRARRAVKRLLEDRIGPAASTD